MTGSGTLGGQRIAAGERSLPASPAAPSDADGGLRRVATLAPLVVLLALWLWLLYSVGAFAGGPNGKNFETDFAIYMGGAQVVRDGGTPYDHSLLLHTERSYLRANGVPAAELPALDAYSNAVIRLGNPPLFFWAMQPLTRLPFQATAIAWMLTLYALICAGFLGALSYLGWRRRVIPTLLFLAMPPVVMGAYYGNIDGVAFAAIGIGLALLRRRPFLAGAIFGLAWLKPQVALPIVLLIILFHPPYRRRLIAGLAAATALMTGLTLVTSGWSSLALWIGGSMHYQGNANIQPDIATLAGLYAHWVPTSALAPVGALALLVAFALTAARWYSLKDTNEVPLLAFGWLWAVWILASPYAHFHDWMPLAIPILAALGRDGSRVSRFLPILMLYLVVLSVVPLAVQPGGVNLLSIPFAAIAVCLTVAAYSPGFRPA